MSHFPFFPKEVQSDCHQMLRVGPFAFLFVEDFNLLGKTVILEVNNYLRNSL